jgi:hypothetical protein
MQRILPPVRPCPGRWRSVAAWIRVLLLLSLATGAPARGADPLPPAADARGELWEADGPVRALLARDGILYLGGSFSHISPPGHRAAELDLFTGATAAEFPSIRGAEVVSAVADGAGGWILGGRFTTVGGVAVTNLVRIGADRIPDRTFAPNPNGTVRALVRSGQWLFVGGDFTTLGGTPVGHVARWNLATGAVEPWGNGVDSAVNTLVAAGDRVYVGGSFTHAGAVERVGLVSLDAATGALVADWTPPVFTGEVLALLALDDRLLVAGTFPSVGGEARNGLAAVDLATARLLPWAPMPSAQSRVDALQGWCDTVFVGGSFLTMGGAARQGVAQVDLESGLTLDWDAHLTGHDTTEPFPQVNALLLAGDRLLLGGDFAAGPGAAHEGLAALDLETARVLPWTPVANATVKCLAVDGRRLIAGFDRAPGGVDRRSLASLDERTGKPTPWNPGVLGEVRALAIAGERLFVGGAFTQVSGQGATNLAAVSIATGLAAPAWTTPTDAAVNALAVVEDLLIAGGEFHSLGGVVRSRLGAVAIADGTVLPGWRCDAGNTVRALAASSGQVFVGGLFPNLGGQTRPRVALVDGKTGTVLPWTPSPAPSISGANTLAVTDDRVFVGMQGPPYLAAYTAGGGLSPEGMPRLDGAVGALVWSGDRLYVGGGFRHAGEEFRPGLMAVGASGDLLEWNPAADAPDVVLSFAATGQSLAVGGASNPGLGDRSTLKNNALFSRSGAPAWIRTPVDVQAAPHAGVHLTVEAQGASPLTYAWEHSGIPIPGITGPVLDLPDVSPAEAGDYRVLVSNPVGTVAADFYLQVLAAPVISAGPLSATPALGASLTLTVAASASPPPVYQWRLNGVNIPGAVDAVLRLENVTAQSGGTYTVVVANSVGSAITAPALIRVPAQTEAFSDVFGARGNISEASGTRMGTNTGATREPTEPRHAGKPGGSSVWIAWTAPFTGVATFSTRGSSFDTILGVYTNTTLASLREVASDDDSGGFATSQVVLNVMAGTQYQIAVDGLGGATGQIVLSWNASPEPADLPPLDVQPVHPTVAEGGGVTLQAGGVPGQGTRIQWFHDCRSIAGATNLTLRLDGVGAQSVGSYYALFRTASGRVVSSRPSVLEVGPATTVHTVDKPEEASDLFFGPPPSPAPALAGLDPGPGAMLLSLGNSVSQLVHAENRSPAMPPAGQCTLYTGSPTMLVYTQAVVGRCSSTPWGAPLTRYSPFTGWSR